DSADLRLDFGTGYRRTVTVELPAPGRATEAVFRVHADASGDSILWRPLDAELEGRGPTPDSATRSRIWVEVTPERSGAVMISVDPDWEPRTLLPVLERAVPGGARAYLQVGDGTWLRVGRPPSGGVTVDRVSRAASSANLLVVQGDPSKLPAWLRSAARQRPALLFLIRGTGDVPGTEVAVREALPGEWYAGAPPPPGPVSADLIGVDPADLPPLTRLFGSPSANSPVLLALRNRRGPPRPVAVTGSSGERRWAVVYGEGTWRWAARGGGGLALYRGLYSGMIRWLVERSAPRPVELSEPYVRAGDSLRWRAAPGVSDLAIQVRDSAGTEIWSRHEAGSTRSLAGPPIGPMEAGFVATGLLGDVPFRIERPFHVNAGTEELPGPWGPALDVRPDEAADRGADARSETPAWPFAAAIVLLCAEWLWRRRIGLR
nr:hypothetical protein [Candidatus Palauibacterales bacterium]